MIRRFLNRQLPPSELAQLLYRDKFSTIQPYGDVGGHCVKIIQDRPHFIQAPPAFPPTVVTPRQQAIYAMSGTLTDSERARIDSQRVSDDVYEKSVANLNGNLLEVQAGFECNPQQMARVAYREYTQAPTSRVSRNQVATALLWQSAITQFILHPHCVINCNETDTHSWHPDPRVVSGAAALPLIRRMIRIEPMFGSLSAWQACHLLERLSPAQEVTFERLLQDATGMEAAVMSIVLPDGAVDCYSPMLARLNEFARMFKPLVSKEDKQKRLYLPSFTISALIESLVAGENTLDLVPAVGRHSRSDILNGLRSQARIIGLNHPDLPPNDVADHQYAGPAVFALHDLYHHMRTSMIARNERWALISTAQAVEKYLNELPSDSREWRRVDRVLHKLVDMEFHNSKTGTPFNAIFAAKYVPWNRELIELVRETMQEENWAETIGVTF